MGGGGVAGAEETAPKQRDDERHGPERAATTDPSTDPSHLSSPLISSLERCHGTCAQAPRPRPSNQTQAPESMTGHRNPVVRTSPAGIRIATCASVVTPRSSCSSRYRSSRAARRRSFASWRRRPTRSTCGKATSSYERVEPGREFFVLVDGTVEVTAKGRKIAELSGGDWFGEIALLTKVPRTATVTSTSAGPRALVVTEPGVPPARRDDAVDRAQGARERRRAARGGLEELRAA